MKAKTILQELKGLHNETRAAADQRYHKSSREHWGIPAPLCNPRAKAAARALAPKAALLLARELWSTNLFDPMIFAAKLLGHLPPSAALWRTLLDFLPQVDGWALEDTLAHAAWKCLLADEALLHDVEAWTRHPRFWVRRAALVYTLPFAKPGQDPERMLQWASSYADDPEWFIQKAIGWWLRVLGAHNPERVRVFLRAHWELLKGVARREATRKLKKEVYHDLDFLVGTWSAAEAEEFEQATREFERID